MKAPMRATSMMFAVETLDELRRLAHLDSLSTGRQVTPSSIVRELVEQYVGERREVLGRRTEEQCGEPLAKR